MLKAALSTLMVAALIVATPVGCSKDLGLDATRFSCQTDEDCGDKICDPLAKVCKAPGEDVSAFNLADAKSETLEDVVVDTPAPDAEVGAETGAETVADADAAEADVAPEVVLGPPPTCQEYCDAVMLGCGSSNDNASIGQYGSVEQCLSVCQTTFFDGGTVDIRGGKGATSGNTLACRLTHALAAQGPSNANATDKYKAAVANCEVAGYTGGNVCGTWCDTYCHLNASHCEDNYTSDSECQTACAGLSADGSPRNTVQNNVHCRVYHAITAGLDKPSSALGHCGHVRVEATEDQCSEPVTEPTCEAYCQNLNAYCTGPYFGQFGGDKAQCENACSALVKLEAGKAWEKDTNTIGCRLFHARAAQFDPVFHCPAATIESNDTCGTWCDNYCHLAQTNCTGSDALFVDEPACQTACAEYSDTGQQGDIIGDSVQCRSYHLLVAGADASAATLHCPHGSVASDPTHCNGPTPEPTCDELCTILDDTCPAGSGNEVFLNNTACLNYCYQQAVLPAGSYQDSALNTVGCRINAAQNASEDPATWCEIAGSTGGGECGTLCKNYCDLALGVCTGDNQLYNNEDDCFFACSSFTEGNLGDTTGNTLQCRIYHVLAAASNPPTSQDTHCGHAGATPTSECLD